MRSPTFFTLLNFISLFVCLHTLHFSTVVLTLLLCCNNNSAWLFRKKKRRASKGKKGQSRQPTNHHENVNEKRRDKKEEMKHRLPIQITVISRSTLRLHNIPHCMAYHEEKHPKRLSGVILN